MKIRKSLGTLAAGALLSLAAGTGLAADSIKIGSFLFVTGPASFLGDPELKTLQMYVEEINANGGVDGRPIELVHYDTGGNAKEAVNFAKRLMKKDRVDLIVGGSTSGSTLAVIPLVEKERVPFISLAGSVKIIDPVKKWVFKMPHTDRMAAAKIFEDMKKRGITKVALISGSGGFGKSGRAQSLALAPEYGIEIVSDESYGAKDTDMTAQLTKIRDTDAQAILNFGFGTGPAIVTKNVRQLGITLPLYQSTQFTVPVELYAQKIIATVTYESGQYVGGEPTNEIVMSMDDTGGQVHYDTRDDDADTGTSQDREIHISKQDIIGAQYADFILNLQYTKGVQPLKYMLEYRISY